MTQTATLASPKGSRLVRFLSELSVTGVEVSHKNFAERLGRLIDLSDSIALSKTHGQLTSISAEAATRTDSKAFAESVLNELLQTREQMVQFILRSFSPETGWLTLPTANAKATPEELMAYEAYQRFYVTHQREIDFKAKSLRRHCREAISDLSPQMAQLAALDAALDDTLEVDARKLFTGVPRLLGKRFKYLLQQHQQTMEGQRDDPSQWTLPGGWLDVFYKEMQGLLLAELEARLQPALGLIEALNTEVEKNL